MTLNYFVSFASVCVGVCAVLYSAYIWYILCEIGLLEKNKVREHIGVLNLNYHSVTTLN